MPTTSDTLRSEAARLVHLLLRFTGASAHPFMAHTSPGQPRLGTDALLFSPSWVPVPMAEVEHFLAALPGPALLASGLVRVTVHLTLAHELEGERRRWAERTLSNQAAVLEDLRDQLGLEDTARVLVEFDDERHVFSLATLRYWVQQIAVEVGWNLKRLDGEPDADACLMLLRPDGKPFPGRSSMLRPGWRRSTGDAA